jgi:hypothetical protein
LSSISGYFLRLFPLAKAGIQNIKTSEGICEGECHFGGFGAEVGGGAQSGSQIVSYLFLGLHATRNLDLYIYKSNYLFPFFSGFH